MIFHDATYFQTLPESDPDLVRFMNYNPPVSRYFNRQSNKNIPGRDPRFIDRVSWRGYDRVWTKYLKDRRYQDNNILEIGTSFGYGLLAFSRYFENSTMHGIDIVEKNYLEGRRRICMIHPKYSKCTFHCMDSTLSKNWNIFDGIKFDIIFEDGAHDPDSQLQTVKNALPFLAKGGHYLIEDIDHRYGDDKLGALSDFLYDCADDYNVNVYSHFNEGLDFLVRSGGIKNLNVSRKGFDATAYIAVISDTKNGSK